MTVPIYSNVEPPQPLLAMASPAASILPMVLFGLVALAFYRGW